MGVAVGRAPQGWSLRWSCVGLRAGLCCCRRGGQAAGSGASQCGIGMRGCCQCGVLRGGERSLDPLAAFAVPGWVETAVTHPGPGSVCQPWGGELQRWRREQRLVSLSSFGDRWVPGIHDSPTVNEGPRACPLSWQAWSLRGRGQLLGPRRGH